MKRLGTGDTVRGGARGAGAGAAIGEIAGGIKGRRGAKQEEQAAASGEEDSLKRAFGACMEGRGYSVK